MNQAQAKDSSEDCWQILGLNDDADKRAVKSAYAKRLKKTRPDDDPEGFQRLHAAYKRASQLAKKSTPQPATDSTTVISHKDPTPSAESTEHPIDIHKTNITQTTRIFPSSTILTPAHTESSTQQLTPPLVSDNDLQHHDTTTSIPTSTKEQQPHNNPAKNNDPYTNHHIDNNNEPLAQHDQAHYHGNLFDEQADTHQPHHNHQQRIEPSFDEVTPTSLPQTTEPTPTQPQTSSKNHSVDHSADPTIPPQTPFPKSTHYQIETDQATQAAIAQQKMNDDELVQDWEVLFIRATGLLNDPKRVNTIGEWKFLERLPSMMDLQFKAQASDYLFGLIAEANEVSLEKQVLYIKQPTLDYLNQTFAWEDKWLDYNEKFSDSLLNAVYPFLSTEQTSDHTPVSSNNPYYKRILAFILDSSFAFGAAYGLALLFANNGEKSTFVFFILKSLLVYFLIIIPIMEFTRLQASIGKWFVGLHVINRQGLKISVLQSVWRSFSSLCCILGMALILWLNLFFMYRYNLLTQDLITRSYVTHSGKGFSAFLKRLFKKKESL